jgi:hypothetical protein
MKRSDAVLDRAKVREVTGIFYSRAALDDAVQALLLAGFDRADIDQIGSVEEMYRRLGAEVAPEELPDVPEAPREHYVGREDVTTTVVAIASTLAALAAMLGALAAIASGRGTGAAVGVAIVTGAIAFGIGFVAAARLTGRDPRRGSDPLEETHGLILWVRVRSDDREDKAVRILQKHGARAVRVHVVDLPKTIEDIPLATLPPDPWLGPERLGGP